ncbi:hypothetical protein ACQ4M3_37295 [Leptolyngbya sp. AN03gr2]|uniref:hypothetical protein n=1 Tax=unclassified Leptolyngbya TaxID=2650499 RepID=UPI003D322375
MLNTIFGLIMVAVILLHIAALRSHSWRNRQQSIWLQQEAELIHNDLLQRLFVIRRSLEMLESESVSHSISQVDQIYHLLFELSDRLSVVHFDNEE